MPKRQGVKIVILLILLLIGLVCGWYMYRRLNYNKQVFDTDIYACIPPGSKQVININREPYRDNLNIYEPDFDYLITPLSAVIGLPIIITADKDTNKTLLCKTNLEQEGSIKYILRKDIAPAFAPKVKLYKNQKIYFYSLPNNRFLLCTFYKGIFAASYSLKSIQEFINLDSENTFFSSITNKEDEDVVYKIKHSSPISVFLKNNDNILALNYAAGKDSMILDGYILNRYYNQPIDSCIAYQLPLRDSLCLDYFSIADSNKMTMIKIRLNKSF